jgi:hypothetical protein
VAVVRPSAASSNHDDALNRRVQNIHWTNVNARQTLDRVTSVIFDAPVAVTPGSVNPKTFAVDSADGTVSQVLNAAAKAGGLFWWTQTEKAVSGWEALMGSLAGFDDRVDGELPIVPQEMPEPPVHGEFPFPQHFLGLASLLRRVMRDLAVLFVHLLATAARLAGPGGARPYRSRQAATADRQSRAEAFPQPPPR